jgi:hypothetical protein
LNVIMPINEDGRLRRIYDLFAVHDGVASGGAYLHLLQANLLHTLLDFLGTTGYIPFVLGVCAYTGDAEQVEEFVEEAVLVGFDIAVEVLHGLMVLEWMGEDRGAVLDVSGGVCLGNLCYPGAVCCWMGLITFPIGMPLSA